MGERVGVWKSGETFLVDQNLRGFGVGCKKFSVEFRGGASLIETQIMAGKSLGSRLRGLNGRTAYARILTKTEDLNRSRPSVDHGQSTGTLLPSRLPVPP